MDQLRGLRVRTARPADAADLARIYIESWHDTYPAVLSRALLCAMTPKGQTARWQTTIRGLLRRAVRDGGAPRELDSDAVAALIIATLTAMTLPHLRGKNRSGLAFKQLERLVSSN